MSTVIRVVMEEFRLSSQEWACDTGLCGRGVPVPLSTETVQKSAGKSPAGAAGTRLSQCVETEQQKMRLITKKEQRKAGPRGVATLFQPYLKLTFGPPS